MTTPNFKKFNIEAYKPGKSKVKKLRKIIKLSANESALGMSPKVRKLISNKKLVFEKYPDGRSRNLRKVISKTYKCNYQKIICGAGSDEIIQMICQLFLRPKDEVVLPEYSFLMYRIYSKIVGAKVVFAKERNFKVSVKDIIKNISNKTKIVFIANPNNPTGTYLTKTELFELRKKLNKKILLVIDDAYAEYMKNKDYSSGLDMFKNKNNVFILRTFSKIFGLASLKRFLEKYNISSNEVSANFLLLDFENCKYPAKFFYEKLKSKGILLRSTEDGYHIKNKLRLTIGSKKENLKFMATIKQVLK